MKNMKLVVSAVFLAGAVGLGMTSAGAEGVISKDVLTEGSYCHMKFSAIREGTLDGSSPVLKDSGDVIDFYGPCDHDPLGKDEISAQRLQNERLRTREYSD